MTQALTVQKNFSLTLYKYLEILHTNKNIF